MRRGMWHRQAAELNEGGAFGVRQVVGGYAHGAQSVVTAGVFAFQGCSFRFAQGTGGSIASSAGREKRASMCEVLCCTTRRSDRRIAPSAAG